MGCGARFPPDKQHRKDRKRCKARDDERTAPSERAALDNCAGEKAERCDRGDLTRQVYPALRRSRRLAGKAPRQPQPRKADRQINEEDRAPADQCDQAAAHNGTSRQRKACAGGPDTDRASTSFFVRIGVTEQRQRVRHQNGGRQALGTARGNQRRCIGRQRAGDGGRRKQGKARDEYPLRTDPVAQCTRRQDEGRKSDGVGAHHPLQFGNAAAKRGSDGIERGVDDGDVELNHAITETHRRERQRRCQL